MLDRPLQINDWTVTQGEKLMWVCPGRKGTFLQLYSDWRFYQTHKELKKYGAENLPAFWLALCDSVHPRKFTYGYRRATAGLYHWYRYVWLVNHYKGLWEQIQRVNKQVRKASK